MIRLLIIIMMVCGFPTFASAGDPYRKVKSCYSKCREKHDPCADGKGCTLPAYSWDCDDPKDYRRFTGLCQQERAYERCAAACQRKVQDIRAAMEKRRQEKREELDAKLERTLEEIESGGGTPTPVSGRSNSGNDYRAPGATALQRLRNLDITRIPIDHPTIDAELERKVYSEDDIKFFYQDTRVAAISRSDRSLRISYYRNADIPWIMKFINVEFGYSDGNDSMRHWAVRDAAGGSSWKRVTFGMNPPHRLEKVAFPVGQSDHRRVVYSRSYDSDLETNVWSRIDCVDDECSEPDPSGPPPKLPEPPPELQALELPEHPRPDAVCEPCSGSTSSN